jgi:glycosyltransferase involved in cell wall biosynthesis
MNKNIGIISIYQFPNELAATNRIIAYSKGMIANAAEVRVFLPFPTENYGVKSEFSGEGNFQNISYCYTSGRKKNKYKIIRAIAILSGIRRMIAYTTSCLRIYKEHKNKAIDCIIISTDSIRSLFVYSILSRFLNISSVFIFDEFPIPIRHKLKDKIPYYKEALYKMVLVNISGYISISQKLKEYYCNFVEKPTLILSTITDVSRFTDITTPIDHPLHSYICYMGNMELSKDDVDNIIRAFAVISPEYSEIQLHLYGSPNKENRKIIEDLITKLDLKEKVIIKGKADYHEVPGILKNAKILVSSQPDTKRASGGFPTKLGEYLAAGVPTLLTNVGENSKYVKDKIHVYFSEPSDYKLYAEKLEYILANYGEAKNVAKNGQNFLLENFSHIKKGAEMLDFILKLKD